MENSKRDFVTSLIFWVVSVAGAMFAALILGAILYPLFVGDELKFIIRLFIVLYVVQVFALLRLYNSIVQNTRFLIKMRESALRLREAFPALERAMRSLRSSNDNITAKISVNSERLKRLAEEIASDIEQKERTKSK